MKCDVMPSLVQLEKKELQKLCRQVKETVATEIDLPAKRSASFGIADLWSLQRRMKTAGRMLNNRSRTYVVRG
ncbi:MAG TPA: hypothetical protein VJU78_01335 [Chitinophagaceae bacterium]|nr:hypothetical protein [Chitinophagaceae bacterium]